VGPEEHRRRQSAGIPVVIFGGPRGDVKLFDDASAAGSLAETVASIDQSVVVDLDALSRTKQEKFLTVFLDRLYESNRRPLLLFCDEADRYAPQKPMSQDALMSLSSSEDIARRGRKRGIGSVWLTQRTAVLNKNVSEFANLTTSSARRARRTCRSSRSGSAGSRSKDVVKEVMRLAPGLADGEAFFLSSHPKLRKYMPDPVRPVQLPLPWTFDSSATPGVEPAPARAEGPGEDRPRRDRAANGGAGPAGEGRGSEAPAHRAGPGAGRTAEAASTEAAGDEWNRSGSR
jgi:hypothetical protein